MWFRNLIQCSVAQGGLAVLVSSLPEHQAALRSLFRTTLSGAGTAAWHQAAALHLPSPMWQPGQSREGREPAHLGFLRHLERG